MTPSRADHASTFLNSSNAHDCSLNIARIESRDSHLSMAAANGQFSLAKSTVVRSRDVSRTTGLAQALPPRLPFVFPPSSSHNRHLSIRS